ncbi:hypothetical protein QW71_19860 [Paenibacillus sp. IHB B 3415]|uniref:DNA-directed RNA polymerase subunit alpha C-terminal domain-containing protein n=1 Tax=Paenibacillus sp. IHB B 3415 TaxID=867080 RepID=UPI000573D0B6|nr:DNA-directed RNA polymerase subunit alpha C-terminal domain-containing protein [Paenibacillus sp. IHB B 3415]KHL94069.1 hypothetical protein QW71_19860 [Paenibacillus sp. IHB B 3415]
MQNAVSGNMPLMHYIPVPEVFHPFPIHFLRIAAPDYSNKSISRILNSLQENDYTIIDKVLNTTVQDLKQTRNFGEKGLHILLDLLNTISDKPELILETGSLDKPLRDEIERLKRIPPVKKQLFDLGIDI